MTPRKEIGDKDKDQALRRTANQVKNMIPVQVDVSERKRNAAFSLSKKGRLNLKGNLPIPIIPPPHPV